MQISHNKLFSKHFLIVESTGVQYYENRALGTRRFPFQRIVSVLLAPDGRLSFQVDEEVFTIQTIPGNPEHQAAMITLVQGCINSQAVGEAPEQPIL